jgi:uncharacterized protein YecE (DUF72 family)
MIYVGTAGFTYPDWRTTFYPRGVPQRLWLEYYAERFSTLELNTTFHGVPKPSTVTGWVERTPPHFQFSVKAHRGLTHDRVASTFVDEAAAFSAMLQPLIEAGKLACVLAQFPTSFRATALNTEYLLRLRAGLGDLPLVVEFRHASWATPTTFSQLRALRLGFVCVDEPHLPGLMPAVTERTGPVAYVRFHGRNTLNWRKAGWQRYDYDYSDEELEGWVEPLRALDADADRTMAIFNNTPRGQALGDAHALRLMLGDAAK